MMKISELSRKVYCAINPDRRFLWLARHGFYDSISDEEYVRRYYKGMFGKELKLNPPTTFNEKMQWLKLHDRKPEYSTIVDKYLVKDYVAGIIGQEYIIPTYGVWEHFDQIDFDKLPNSFVLKCTHDSGGLVICKDKNLFEKEPAKKKLEKSLSSNYFKLFREWPYKDVKPRIIAEEYMIDNSVNDLPDYKIHCFEGKPLYILVCSGRFSTSGMTEDFYDNQWNKVNISRPQHPNSNACIKPPSCLDEMLQLATKLSDGYPFLRTDFYVVNGKPYFGELTLYPASGLMPFVPDEWDYKLGELFLNNI